MHKEVVVNEDARPFPQSQSQGCRAHGSLPFPLPVTSELLFTPSAKKVYVSVLDLSMAERA